MRFFGKSKKFIISEHTKTMLLGFLALISLTAVLSVGPIYAYLKATSEPAVNNVDASPSATPVVNSDYSISVGDTSDSGDSEDTGYSVYVRAAVVCTWQNGTDVYGTPPSCTIPFDDRYWSQSGNYYYYNTAVQSGLSTQPLLTGSVTTSDTAPDGYSLDVEILAQTIQAVGKKNGVDAVTDAWGWTPGA